MIPVRHRDSVLGAERERAEMLRAEDDVRRVVQHAMREWGYSPVLVATYTQISRSAFSAWLHGHRGMSAARLARVLKVLRLEVVEVDRRPAD